MNEIQIAVTEETALSAYQSGGIRDIVERIKQEAKSIVLDPSTDKGRKEIASVAYKIAQSKTKLDELGKSLTEDARKQIDTINEERRFLRDELDALKAEVRYPLTEYENREKARIKAHEDALQSLDMPIEQMQSQEQIKAAIDSIKSAYSRDWQEYAARAKAIYESTLSTLENALADRIKYEAEQAEFERLRKEAAEREQKEREERIAKEAAERAKREAEEAAEKERQRIEEERRKEREESERKEREAKEREERLQREKKEAEERAKREVEEARQQAIRDAEAKEAKRIEAERKAKEAAEAKARNEAHRNKIKRAALSSLIAATGIEKSTAKSVLSAIENGKVENVTINY